MSNHFTPTAEQDAIVSAFTTGENLKVTAVAGSGKTSTLRLLGEATQNSGTYIAFNRSVKDQAKATFPKNVKSYTNHGLAFPSHGAPVADRVFKAPRMYGRQIANAIGIYEGFGSGENTLVPAQVAPLVMEMVGLFCNSADEEITLRHAPWIEGIENPTELAAFLLPYARKAWADVSAAKGKLKTTHDHYLKAWALTHPKIDSDFILFDEGQDANPVIAQVVAEQDHAQVIVVGDESQSIYGWRGAVNALANFPGRELTLTQSFRFGPRIAEEANKWLEILDAPVRVKGLESIDSRIESLPTPDAILCRTNAACIQEALEAQQAGKATAIVGGTKEIESFTKAAERLQQNLQIDHQDLVAFQSWSDVCDYVQNDKAGADLKVRVNLINQYGTGAILDVCNNSVNEDKAEVIVSTAHKAKGCEWNTVRVATDFREPVAKDDGQEAKVSRTDAMLAYVTVTRAKLVLDNAGLAWVDNFIGKE